MKKKSITIFVFIFLFSLTFISAFGFSPQTSESGEFGFPSGTTTTYVINASNHSDYWDTTIGSLDNVDSTSFQNNAGTLEIVLTWFSDTFDTYFGGKTTDDLTQGSTNLYDNESWNESYANTLYADISVVDTNETTRFNTLVGTDCGAGNYSYGFDDSGNIQCREDTDIDTNTNCSADNSCPLIIYESEIGIYYNNITNFTGTLIDGKICIYDSSTQIINCSYTDISGGNTTEEMQDAVGSAFDGTLVYDDAGNGMGINMTYINNTIEELDSDTTYSSGSNLTLTDTTFSLNVSSLQTYLATIFHPIWDYDFGDLINVVITTSDISDGTIKAEDINTTDLTLSDLTDDLGDRGYTSLSNFTNDLGVINGTDGVNGTNGIDGINGTNLFTSINQTQMDNSTGVLNILESWLKSLFYTESETDTQIENANTSMKTYVDGQGFITSESDSLAYNGTLALNSSLSNYYPNSNPSNFWNSTTGIYNFSGKMFVNGTTGYVGIGTTSPTSLLHIYKSSPTANEILFNISTNAGTRFSVDEDGDTNINGTLKVDGDTINTGGQNAATVYGDGATATDQRATAIGDSAVAGYQSVAIGLQASANTLNSFALGKQASANYLSSITIGTLSTATAAHQLVMGGSTTYIDDVYVGRGVTHSSPNSITYHATGGSGTDVTGGDFVIAGGKSTGNATGGDIFFQTSNAGASGTTLQSLTTKMAVIGSNVGIGTTAPNQELQVDGNVNVSGTIYYGSLQANSPFLYYTDDDFHIDIKKATNGNYYIEYVDENLETQREWVDCNSELWYQKESCAKLKTTEARHEDEKTGNNTYTTTEMQNVTYYENVTKEKEICEEVIDSKTNETSQLCHNESYTEQEPYEVEEEVEVTKKYKPYDYVWDKINKIVKRIKQ